MVAGDCPVNSQIDQAELCFGTPSGQQWQQLPILQPAVTLLFHNNTGCRSTNNLVSTSSAQGSTARAYGTFPCGFSLRHTLDRPPPPGMATLQAGSGWIAGLAGPAMAPAVLSELLHSQGSAARPRCCPVPWSETNGLDSFRERAV